MDLFLTLSLFLEPVHIFHTPWLPAHIYCTQCDKHVLWFSARISHWKQILFKNDMYCSFKMCYQSNLFWASIHQVEFPRWTLGWRRGRGVGKSFSNFHNILDPKSHKSQLHWKDNIPLSRSSKGLVLLEFLSPLYDLPASRTNTTDH